MGEKKKCFIHERYGGFIPNEKPPMNLQMKQMDNTYVDITQRDLKKSTQQQIQFLLDSEIKNMPDLKQKLQTYDVILKIQFFNIIACVIATKFSNSQFDFKWIFNNDPESYCAEIYVEIMGSEMKTLDCSIATIRTRGLKIPDLIMNNRTYKQSAVPMLFALYFIRYLNWNTAEITDDARVECKCTFGDESIQEVKLLNQRMLLCKDSIYSKYGFLNGTPMVKICQIPIQRIIDDYLPRVDDAYVAKQILKPWTRSDYKQSVNIVRLLLNELQQAKDTQITIQKWLSQFTDKNIQACKAAMFEYLNDLLTLAEQISLRNTTNLEYQSLPLFARSKEETGMFLHNNDIAKTIEHIYKNGFSTVE